MDGIVVNHPLWFLATRVLSLWIMSTQSTDAAALMMASHSMALNASLARLRFSDGSPTPLPYLPPTLVGA